MTLQISQKQGKLDLNAITIVPSRLLIQHRVIFGNLGIFVSNPAKV